jgi:hypothetical protein
MRLRSRGASLVELLMSLLMTIIIAGALFAVFTNTYASRDFAVGQGSAETDARTPLDNLADHLRDAQQYHSVEPPTAVSQSSVIANGTATSVTYYKSNSSSDTVRLWLNGTDLDRTADGSTTTILKNVQTLEFQYFKTPSASGNYNNSSLVATTDNSHSPTAAELPLISEITIRANVNDDGFQRELACVVRLRNSPYKLHL